MGFPLVRSLVFPGSWFLYLLRPPPPPPLREPPREFMLDEPRELLARAELPLIPPLLIPRDPLEPDVLRLPTRSPPPPPRFPPPPAPPPRSPPPPRLSPTPPRLSPAPPRLSPTPPRLSPTPPRLSPTPPRLSPTPPRLSPTPPRLSPTPPRLSPTPPRLPWPRFDMFCRAFACRSATDDPRVVPPNLFAVCRSEYGAPPRCFGLCCQLPPPAPPRAG